MAEGFARLLKRHRIAAGLSQERLAELAGVSADAISALERGAHRAPYKATLDLLIAALGLDDNARREIEEAAKLARARRPHAQRRDVLPLQLTSFVDREREVAEIKELLRSHRLVTVAGTGGAGKTRTTIEVAQCSIEDYDDGVWFAELAPTSDPALVTTVIAEALGVREATNRPMFDTLLSYLKRKRLLLILDNCEHVLDEARRMAAAILHGCPDVRILATSRESFRTAGEQVYHLPSLPVPSTSRSLSAEEMAQYGAVQLFAERAVSADNRFVVTPENAGYVAEICRRLDGIPLAIELAAARLKVLSPHELAQKLDERFRVLTAGDPSALPRHRTMRALIDWSYDLLTEDERRLFRKLSIFAGGFTLESAAQICRDDGDELAALEVLSSLVDKSLVQTEPSTSARRYRLLESTREYAREKLIEAGEQPAVARDHARAFLTLAEQLRDTWETTPDREWLARAEPELDNFRAALGWSLGMHGDVLLGQRLAGDLDTVWRYFPTEGRRWVQAAEQQVAPDTPASVLAALDLAEAQFALDLNQFNASLQAGERALARYSAFGDPRAVAQSKLQIGRAQIYLQRIAEGEALTRQVLETVRTLGAGRLVVYALHNLALGHEFAGDLSGARQRYTEALAAARAVGAERSVAVVAMNLAEAEFQGGDVHAALRLAQEALPILAYGDARFVATGRANLAAYLVALRRFDDARGAAREALSDARDMQWSVGLVLTLQHLAAIGALRPDAQLQELRGRRRAARILGYVEVRLVALEALRQYTEQQEYDAMIEALRSAFGESELPAVMAEGGVWSEDRAIAEAMLI